MCLFSMDKTLIKHNHFKNESTVPGAQTGQDKTGKDASRLQTVPFDLHRLQTPAGVGKVGLRGVG